MSDDLTPQTRKPGIYIIINLVNNKVYVGQSIHVSLRLTQHKKALINNKHHNYHLQNAFNKYALANFAFIPLLFCQEDLLDTLEKVYITDYESLDPLFGYNKNSGGNLNKRPSQETLKKQSLSHMGQKASPKQKQIISALFKGKPKSEKHKENMRKPKSEEHKETMRKPKSASHKLNMSRARSGEGAAMAKLTWDIVDRIRKNFDIFKVTQKDLASWYGVSRGTIRKVLCNISWKVTNV